MTELEGHLLNALEHLQQDYMRRLNEWESAFAELQKMHEVTQRNNAILNERVVIWNGARRLWLSAAILASSALPLRNWLIPLKNNHHRNKRDD